MGSIYRGESIKISVFGESHGAAIGAVIDGFPAGIRLNREYIQAQLDRRKPSSESYSTKRKEADEFKVLSGISDGATNGSPLCLVIENTDARPKDYSKGVFRPSHADYTANVRYNGNSAGSGGGHFSGRLTAPLVMAGAVCADYLLQKFGVKIYAHIKSVYDIQDDSFDPVSGIVDTEILYGGRLPVLNKGAEESMLDIITDAQRAGDSLGGTIECMAVNVCAGLGSPNMQGVENRIAALLFAVPAVKGVEFGRGFGITALKGSQANDSMYVSEGKVLTKTNNSGGIAGGITNGMPINFTAAIKPTPSISLPQQTVDAEGNERELCIKGRHDPCIVPRAVPVIESVAAIVIADLYLEAHGHE